MTPNNVSAVIVTRGDVDLTPVLDSLIFDDIIVWNNSLEADQGTYGRILAAKRAKHDVIYSQDDDIIHTPDAQALIVSEYESGVLTGCMWEEWSQGAWAQGIPNGYDDLVFPGSGSVYDAELTWRSFGSYLKTWTFDDFACLWCDTIVGVISPTKHLDIRFETLPCAENDNRMCNLPDAVALKTEAIRRAREVRDGVLA